MAKTTSILAAALVAALAAAPIGIATGATAQVRDDASVAATPPVSAQRTIAIAGKRFAYRVETGFVPIALDDGKGADGRIFYTYYSAAKPGPGRRPVAFVWNGGPGAPSSWLQFQGLGPTFIDGSKLTDNPDTLLPAIDMVFIDPVGTGFSRARSAEAAKKFFNTLGDAEATSRFITTWLQTHRAAERPLFLIGESFGGYRAGGVAERLEARGRRLTGVILVSGGVASGPLIPPKVRLALQVPQRAAATLALGKLPKEIGTDRVTVARTTTQWALSTYLPALVHLDKLSEGEREAIARQLAQHTGFPADGIDRKTLVIPGAAFLKAMSPDPQRPLITFDMRTTALPEFDSAAIGGFYRSLGFETDLHYWEYEKTDSPAAASGARWTYNYRWPESAKYGRDYAEPWLPAALKVNPNLRIWVAAGLYDSLNSCAENDVLLSMLEPDVARSYTIRCYLGGHMMYRDADTRKTLAADLSTFVRNAVEDR